MAVWKNATMTSFYDGDECDVTHCEVRIDGSEIVVSYDDEDGLTVYQGNETGPGHYKLSAPSVSGQATLHRVPDEDVLEGHWIQDGYEGMWRIELKV